MVYCGKPSKGCSNCRERKVRCDQKSPSCGQCNKRQVKCLGYRNMVDLMFRDQSHQVIKRATDNQRQSKKTRVRLDGAVSVPSTISSQPLTIPTSILAMRQPQPCSAEAPLPERQETFTASQQDSLTSANGTHETQVSSDEAGERNLSIASSTRHNNKIACGPVDTLLERGIAFFFARYVATDHGCYQNYDFIYDVWKPPASFDTISNDCITASMAAVGLASLSKLTRCPETFRRARHSYTLALGLANAALCDPLEACKDSTMLSVLILGTYEFVSGRTPQTISAWQQHVNGAATLASMRGVKQFRTKVGTRMFTMLCHTVLISCIRSGLPMPQPMVDLRKELWHLTDTSGPVWRIVDTLYKSLQIRHDIKSGKVVGVDAIITKLCDVEDQFSVLISSLPTRWHYRPAKLKGPHPAVLGDICHIYRDLTQATTWNGVRTMRMLVQETIVEVLCGSVNDPTQLPKKHQSHLVKAMRLIQMLGAAFISSVPQHFGVVSGRDISSDRSGRQVISPVPMAQLPREISSASAQNAFTKTSSDVSSALAHVADRKPTLFDPTQSSGHERGAERFLTLATASHTIIWPLYTLGMSSSTTPEMLAYVLDRLEAIYQETGFEQARLVSNIVKEQVHTLLWDQISTSKLQSIPDHALPMIV